MYRYQILPRRSFLKQASVFALALPVVELGAVSLLGCGRQASSAKQKAVSPGADNVAAKTVIVSDKEPGQPLIVSGTIYSPDGRKPLEGITLYVYQTDATGVYSTQGTGDNRNTRIHGVMRTGADGRYEFRTIKPASYPGTRISAHIHAYVSGADYPEYWIDEYIFADDPFVTDDVKQKFRNYGSFSPILTLTRGSDGILRAVRDIKVERCTNNCVRH
jgi:protocatechuate 3,4-dioxygenase beta subunit